MRLTYEARNHGQSCHLLIPTAEYTLRNGYRTSASPAVDRVDCSYSWLLENEETQFGLRAEASWLLSEEPPEEPATNGATPVAPSYSPIGLFHILDIKRPMQVCMNSVLTPVCCSLLAAKWQARHTI